MLPYKSQVEQFAAYLSTLKTTGSVRDMDKSIVADFFITLAEMRGKTREAGEYMAETFILNYLNLESEIGDAITTDPAAIAAMAGTVIERVEAFMGKEADQKWN